MQVRATGTAVEFGLNGRSALYHRDVVAQILIAFVLSALSIGVIGISVAALMTATTARPIDIAALQALFVESQRMEVRPEPIERAVYLSAILATLPAVLLAVLTARRIDTAKVSAGAVVALATLILAVPLTVVFADSDILTYVLGGNISGRFVGHAEPLHLVMVAAATALTAFLVFRTMGKTSAGALFGIAPHRAIEPVLASIVVLTMVAGADPVREHDLWRPTFRGGVLRDVAGDGGEDAACRPSDTIWTLCRAVATAFRHYRVFSPEVHTCDDNAAGAWLFGAAEGLLCTAATDLAAYPCDPNAFAVRGIDLGWDVQLFLRS